MTDKQMLVEDVKGAGRTIGHAVAILVGLFLLIVGLAMGVSLVLLPPGLIVGATGFMFIVYGLYATPRKPSENDSGSRSV